MKQRPQRNTAYIAPKLTLGYLPSISQTHLPEDGTAHGGLGPFPPIRSQENDLSSPQARLMETILQKSFFFFLPMPLELA